MRAISSAMANDCLLEYSWTQGSSCHLYQGYWRDQRDTREAWCEESQETYVHEIKKNNLNIFAQLQSHDTNK